MKLDRLLLAGGVLVLDLAGMNHAVAAAARATAAEAGETFVLDGTGQCPDIEPASNLRSLVGRKGHCRALYSSARFGASVAHMSASCAMQSIQLFNGPSGSVFTMARSSREVRAKSDSDNPA